MGWEGIEAASDDASPQARFSETMAGCTGFAARNDCSAAKHAPLTLLEAPDATGGWILAMSSAPSVNNSFSMATASLSELLSGAPAPTTVSVTAVGSTPSWSFAMTTSVSAAIEALPRASNSANAASVSRLT